MTWRPMLGAAEAFQKRRTSAFVYKIELRHPGAARVRGDVPEKVGTNGRSGRTVQVDVETAPAPDAF